MDKLVIDGHAHACGEYLTAEQIKNKLIKAGADMVLLTPGQYGSKTTYSLKNLAKANPLGDVVSKNNRMTSRLIGLIGAIKSIPKGNEFVYQLKQKLPDQVKQCYWVTRANYKNIQSDYERMKFDTIKFHQCWEKFDIEEKYFIDTVEWATKNKLPVFIHVKDLEQMKKLVEFIKKHQDATVIIGHLYHVELFMSNPKEYFANTYFDLSNFYFVSKERTMMAYNYFGADHLLLGSDTPYGKESLENTIKQINELGIPDTDKEKILGLNMANLLKL